MLISDVYSEPDACAGRQSRFGFCNASCHIFLARTRVRAFKAVLAFAIAQPYRTPKDRGCVAIQNIPKQR